MLTTVMMRMSAPPIRTTMSMAMEAAVTSILARSIPTTTLTTTDTVLTSIPAPLDPEDGCL